MKTGTKMVEKRQKCDCEDWKQGINKIDVALIGIALIGTTFELPSMWKRYVMSLKFCPWCRKRLLSENLPETSRKILEGKI